MHSSRKTTLFNLYLGMNVWSLVNEVHIQMCNSTYKYTHRSWRVGTLVHWPKKKPLWLDNVILDASYSWLFIQASPCQRTSLTVMHFCSSQVLLSIPFCISSVSSEQELFSCHVSCDYHCECYQPDREQYQEAQDKRFSWYCRSLKQVNSL